MLLLFKRLTDAQALILFQILFDKDEPLTSHSASYIINWVLHLKLLSAVAGSNSTLVLGRTMQSILKLLMKCHQHAVLDGFLVQLVMNNRLDLLGFDCSAKYSQNMLNLVHKVLQCCSSCHDAIRFVSKALVPSNSRNTSNTVTAGLVLDEYAIQVFEIVVTLVDSKSKNGQGLETNEYEAIVRLIAGFESHIRNSSNKFTATLLRFCNNNAMVIIMVHMMHSY